MPRAPDVVQYVFNSAGKMNRYGRHTLHDTAIARVGRLEPPGAEVGLMVRILRAPLLCAMCEEAMYSRVLHISDRGSASATLIRIAPTSRFIAVTRHRLPAASPSMSPPIDTLAEEQALCCWHMVSCYVCMALREMI